MALRKKPSLSEIFKSLDYMRENNYSLMVIFRANGFGYLPEGLHSYEWSAMLEYLEYSTNTKPQARKICQLLRSDIELSMPFRAFVAIALSGELKRGKHNKVTLADRDLWVYLAISYAERQGFTSRYTEYGTFATMAVHIGISETKSIELVRKAFESGERIYIAMNADFHKVIELGFTPKYWLDPKPGQLVARAIEVDPSLIPPPMEVAKR
jgi:hypothetical protein